jgi:hypothetical protein
LNTSIHESSSIHKESVGLSPLRGILKNSGNSPVKFMDDQIIKPGDGRVSEDSEEKQDADAEPERSAEEDEEEDDDEFDLKFPNEYHGKQLKPAKKVDEIVSHDGKIQRFFDNGKKEVVFSNGVKREVWPSGYSIVYFTNNDIKQTFPDQKVVYYFAEAKTT